MATIVASRYAVLSVDDDDEDDISVKKNVSTKKPPEVKPTNAASAKSNENQKKKKKQEVTQPPQPSKNSKPNSGTVNAPKKKKKPVVLQWNEGKKKDPEYMEGNYEEDLSRAIYLSKLDFEKKKDVNGKIAQNDKNKKPNNKKSKKSQKVNAMNTLNSSGSKNSKKDSAVRLKTEEFVQEPQFCAELNNDIKNELSQRVTDLNNQQSLTLVLYKAYIEKRDREIEELKGEVERLNTNLKNVKIRNTKLCQVIANGEMKDKAEVLMEVERLQTIKDELSSEVANLHIQLEQERSRVRQLAGEHKSKEKSKKHHFSSNEMQ